MSNLLISESPLILLPTLAEKIGLNEAIVLQQIHYWINPAYNKNFINNRYWVYNTYAGWGDKFKFWSLDTIKRTFTSLEHRKLILSGNFNTQAMDRTKWYTIDYEQLLRLGSGTLVQNAILDEGKMPSSMGAKSDNASGQNAIFYNKEQRLLTKNTTKNTNNLSEGVLLNLGNQCSDKCSQPFLTENTKLADKKENIVLNIFLYWQKILNRLGAKLDKQRKKYILDALGMGIRPMICI